MRSRDRGIYDGHGDVHFVTSTIVGFVPIFTNAQAARVFIDCIRFCQRRKDFTLLAWVLMPEHFHLVLKRHQEKSVSTIIGNIKRFTSREIQRILGEMKLIETLKALEVAAKEEPSQDSAVWKPRFDSLVIVKEETLRQKIEYIHHNPVRRQLVAEPTAWRYSSARNYAGLAGCDLEVDTEWRCIGYGGMPSGRDS